MAIWNERIRSKRLEKGITLAQIADALGVTEATAQRYESGSIKNVPYEHMCVYGELFNCSPAYLMGWSDEERIASGIERIIEDKYLLRISEHMEQMSEKSKQRLLRYSKLLLEEQEED